MPIGIGLPLNSRSHNGTVTRATLTEGHITLNKDSQPIQTTAAALGINTDLNQANEQVDKPDLNKLKERQEIAALSSQLGAFAAGEIGKRMQWEDGSWQKTALHAAVGAAATKMGGGSWEAAGVAAASPYANQAIKRLTTDSETGKTNLVTNTLAHAALGALEAKATGNNAIAGAVAGGGGELLAHSIAKFAYDVDGTTKTTADLTEIEKHNIKEISRIGAAVAGGLIGDSSQTAVDSAQIAGRAVENNYLFKNEAARKYELEQKARKGIITPAEQQELAEINKLDKARDVKLVSSCVDKMSSACREESKQVDVAKASYSGSELSHVYAYPVYTAYATKYEGDYKKAASFSEQYSILSATREKAYADFETRFDLPKGSVNQVTQWGDVIANTAGLIGTSNIGKSSLSGDFSKSVPKEVNSGSKLDVVGETTNYKTIKVDFNKSIIKGSDESYIVNNLEASANYELSNGTKFKGLT